MFIFWHFALGDVHRKHSVSELTEDHVFILAFICLHVGGFAEEATSSFLFALDIQETIGRININTGVRVCLFCRAIWSYEKKSWIKVHNFQRISHQSATKD